jgi:hypothetical protein
VLLLTGDLKLQIFFKAFFHFLYFSL